MIAPPITKPMLSAICVTIGRRALGTMCRLRTLIGRRPMARAVSTWSASITSDTDARVMKTYCPISPSVSTIVGRIRCLPTSSQCEKPVVGSPGRRLEAAGQPGQRAGEEADEDHADPEVRHRVERERALADPRVSWTDRASRPRRCRASSRSTSRARSRGRAAGACWGWPSPSSSSDGLLGRVRGAEVAVRELAEVAPELRREALVVAALVDDRLAHRRRAGARGSGPSTGRRARGR